MTLYKSNGQEKSDEDRVRRNVPRIDRVTLTPKVGNNGGTCDGNCGPDLPGGFGWCDMTLNWYDMWRHSPQSKLFIDTDWAALQEAALLYDAIWNRDISHKSPSHNSLTLLMGELRRKVAQWGATHYDRIQLKLQIDNPLSAEEQRRAVESDAKDAVDYMEMLTSEAAKIKGD